MVEEVSSLIDDIQTSCNQDADLEEDQKQRIAMYMEIVKDTMESQHKIIMSFEGITKKLEKQIEDSQQALDESTKRETEQLELIIKLKK
jgi:hypothetical protein